jgi:hypothetical protein
MLNREKTRLQIFESFQKDFQLNKLNDILPVDEQQNGLVFNGDTKTSFGFNTGITNGSGEIVGDWGYNQPQRDTLFSRLKRAFFPNSPKPPKESKFDVNKFFGDVKESFTMDAGETIEKQKERITRIYEQAKRMHQVALVEKLEQEALRISMEMRLIENGFPIFVDEEEIVKFCNDNEAQNMKLDWIKNFSRPVPEEVGQEMSKAVSANLFENYVVMHYDPANNGTLATRAEQQADLERRRDPILFGVLSCSTRLYYIGDWEDEYCDLRLTDIIGTDERVYQHVLTSDKMIDLEAHGKIKKLTQGKNPSVTIEKIT